MRSVVFILFVFLIIPENTSKEINKLGSFYNSKLPDSFERLVLNRKYKTTKYVVRSSLRLNKDSTFVLNTCGLNIQGEWMRKQDSLMLNVVNGMYKNDSLNRIRGKVDFSILSSRGMLKYLIKGDNLLGVFSNTEGGRSILFLEKSERSKNIKQ